MSPPRLPSDVLPFIFKELTGHQDLYSVCLTSRIFRVEGQLILFHHPGVLTIGVGDLPHNSFLDAVINSPDRLALMVRSYEQCITWKPHQEPGEAPPMFLPASGSARQREAQDASRRKWLVKRMGCALRLMANIKVLRIWNTDGDRYIHYPRECLPDILQYCKFQLYALTWDRSGEEKAIISQFLPHQKNIKELDLGRRYTGRTGRAQEDAVQPQQLTGICLQLDSLSGSVVMTCLFLIPNDSRKRPVKCLRWTSNPEGYSDWQWGTRNIETSQLNGPLSRLQLLDYDFQHRRPSLLELAPMLGKLAALRICVENLRWTSSNWQKDLVALGRLPALRTLILSISEPRHGGTPNLANYDAATRISEQIFLRSSALQFIDIQGLSGHTERYTRAAPSTISSSARIGSRTKISGPLEYSWSNRYQFLDQ